MKVGPIACLFALAAVVPGLAFAQSSKEVSPTPLQRELYDRAFQAYQLNRFEDSIAYLAAALTVRPFDLLHFSKGRAHYRLGECSEARESYAMALSAPVYDSRDVALREQVEMAVAELESRCPGEIQVRCKVVGIDVEVAGRPGVACGESVKLLPGAYPVVGRLGTKDESHEVEVVAMEVSVVDLQLEPAAQVVVREKATPWLGVGLAAGGVGFLATSIALDLWLGTANETLEATQRTPSDEDDVVRAKRRVDRLRVATLGGYLLSAAALGTGGVLILRTFRGSDDVESALALTPGGVTWVGRW